MTKIEEMIALLSRIDKNDDYRETQIKKIILPLDSYFFKEVWRECLSTSSKNPHCDVIYDILENLTSYKNDELKFFNDCILPFCNSATKVDPIYYFINETSNKWLIENPQILTFILTTCIEKNIHSNVSSLMKNKVRKTLCNKISNLNENEYNQFLDKNIRTNNNKVNVLKFLFQHENLEKITKIKKDFFNDLKPKDKEDLGVILLLRKNWDYIEENKEMILHSINSKMRSHDFIREVASSEEVVNFIYENFNALEEKNKLMFTSDIMSRKLIKPEMLDFYIELKDKHNEKFQESTSIFFMWKIAQGFPKDKKEPYIIKVLEHMKKHGEYEKFKDFVFSEDKKVSFNHVVLDNKNHNFTLCFKDSLHIFLQMDLDKKPEGKKLKI